MKTPFFILCFPRSGSTFLASILNMHSNILMAPELKGLYSTFLKQYKYYGDLKNEFNLKLLSADMKFVGGQIRHFKIKLNPDFLDENISISNRNVKSLIETFYKNILENSGKEQLGEQTPDHTPYLESINNLFPNAKIIHLIRDGRDCSLSQIKRRKDYNIFKSAKLWNAYNELLLKFGQNNKERYLCIKYEELIANPERTIKSICSFLNEPYISSMLDYQKGGFAISNVNMTEDHSNLVKNVMKNNCNKWVTGFSSNELKIFESIAGKTLQKFGYTTSNNFEGFFWSMLKQYQFTITLYFNLFEYLRTKISFTRFIIIVSIKRFFGILKLRDLMKF